MPSDWQLRTNYGKGYSNDGSWWIVILIIILFFIFPPLAIALFILVVVLYIIGGAIGTVSTEISGKTSTILEKPKPEYSQEQLTEKNYKKINRAVPMKGRRKCWYCKKWFENYSAKPISILRDPNDIPSYNGYGTYYWYDTHICRKCYEKKWEGKEMSDGKIFPKWENYHDEFKPAEIKKEQDFYIPIKSIVWATSKWHIYRINIEKDTEHIISIRRWTRKKFKQFGKDTYFSDYERVPKHRRGVHYLDYIKNNDLKLKVEKKVYDDKSLSDNEKEFLKEVESKLVLDETHINELEGVNINVDNLIKDKKLKSIKILSPYIPKEYLNKELFYLQKRNFNKWIDNNFPSYLNKMLNKIKLGQKDILVYIKKNDFRNEIQWMMDNIPNEILIELELYILKKGEPFIIHQKSNKINETLSEKTPVIIKKCKYCHKHFIPLHDFEGIKERIFENYTHINTLNDVNFCYNHVFPTPREPKSSEWESENIDALKKKMIKSLKELVDTIGFIPPMQFHYTIGYLTGLDAEKFERAIVILNGMLSCDYGYKVVFGTWFNTLLEAGLLEDNTLRTSRGYLCVANDGHRCYSLAEKTIDDWLYKHDIEHEKEPKYPGKGNFRADWKVGDYFIEYWGMKGKEDYDHKIFIKRELVKDHDIKLIELNPEDINLYEKLKVLLNKEEI